MRTKELTIRDLDAGDMEDLFNWRNHPFVRAKSFNGDPLSREEHQQWFKRKSQSPDTAIYIGYCGEQKIGMIRFDNGPESIKVSIMMNPDFIGQKLGLRLIELGLRKIAQAQGKGKTVTAEIKEGNMAAIKVFQKAGFQMSYLTYTLEL